VSLQAPRAGISRRGVVIGLAVGVPVSLFFLWLAARGVDWSAMWDALSRARPAGVALAVLVMGLVYVLQAERWRVVARRVARPPRRAFLGMVVGGVAVNNVIPGRAGEFLRAYWLSRSVVPPAPAARCFATVLVDRAADVIALVALLCVSLPFVGAPDWVRGILIVAAAGCVTAVALIAVTWWYSHRSERGRARGVPGAVERSRLRHHLSGLVRGMASTVSARDVPRVAALSLGAWLVWALAAWVVGQSLGIGLSAAEAAFVTGVVNLGVAIPSSPGFIGTYQWLVTAALGLFGVGATEAFAYSILLQAVWFVPTTLAGIVLALTHRAIWRGLRRGSADPAPDPAEAPGRGATV
jgi:hypothetical protein